MSQYDNPRRLTVVFDFVRPGDTALRTILRDLLPELAGSPDQLDTALNVYPQTYNAGTNEEVELRVDHAFLSMDPGERLPTQLVHRYSQANDVLEVEGVRYAGELFRGLGVLPLNTFVKLVAREDGVLTLQTIPEEEWRVPRQDVADLVDWVFARFGQPVDAGELPEHVVKAVRRLEAALATPELVSADAAPDTAALRAALDTINRLRDLGDAIYDLRERVDCSALPDNVSSWEHPDVKAYSDAVAVVKKWLAAP